MQALVDDKGALGFYYDRRRDDYVVVLPATGPGSADLTPADPAFAALAADRVAPAVERSATTRAAIDEFDRRIRAEVRRSNGGYVFGSAFDLARDVMVVTSDAPRDVVRSLAAGLPIAVEHRYGTGGRTSRQYDSAPFRGGAAITVGTAACTSGFTVKSPQGDRYLLTAGHCGHVPGVPIGRPVSNTGSGAFMGYFYNWNYPERDIALIGQLNSANAYNHYIYVGNATGTVKRVGGAADPVANTTGNCHSGVVTFEQCGHRVVTTSGQYCDANGACTRDVIAFDQGTGPTNGDSGAPFYSYNSDRSAVTVHGIVIARAGSVYFAEKWSLIASTQGVGIVTSTP
ncbi:chymotrypsin family serine protease [Saccharothrix syringae]|uniref:Trypsin-like serine protease n=1 Tax=Saccharothrix syringae TaxID=103733 RepID=A0A5Q0H4Y7_SACSY|nr:hypothetical protein [Saccharothrix syringae]QFZ21311.1 hypothetical protein EKG83_31480 [Saccharothrix syringae]